GRRIAKRTPGVCDASQDKGITLGYQRTRSNGGGIRQAPRANVTPIANQLVEISRRVGFAGKKPEEGVALPCRVELTGTVTKEGVRVAVTSMTSVFSKKRVCAASRVGIACPQSEERIFAA